MKRAGNMTDRRKCGTWCTWLNVQKEAIQSDERSSAWSGLVRCASFSSSSCVSASRPLSNVGRPPPLRDARFPLPLLPRVSP